MALEEDIQSSRNLVKIGDEIYRVSCVTYVTIKTKEDGPKEVTNGKLNM